MELLAWSVQDCDGINEEEEIEREGDEKRLEKGAAGAATAAEPRLVRGQILSTCCTMLDVGRMDVGEQNPSLSLPIPHAVGRYLYLICLHLWSPSLFVYLFLI